MSSIELNDYRFTSAAKVRNAKTAGSILGAICLCILVVFLVVGLWPFHAPKNEVKWLSGRNGILLSKRGSLISADSIRANGAKADSACSLEIWLESSRVDSGGTVLAFVSPTDRFVPFMIRQFVSGLELQSGNRSSANKGNRIYVDGVFSRLKPVFLAISSGERGTTIYVDGVLVRQSANFRFVRQDLTGQLILGNGPSTRNNWSGQVERLTVYDRELSALEVSVDFSDWTLNRQSDPRKSEGVSANYLFNEGAGSVVHDQVQPGTALLIPQRYFVIHQRLLELPWSEFHSRWSYWKDVGINIGGFVPLGFFFRAYLSVTGKTKRATGITVALGFAVSLTIEVLQSFLPTRDSGVTDLITNTFGTVLGAMLFAWCMKAGDWFSLASVLVRQ